MRHDRQPEPQNFPTPIQTPVHGDRFPTGHNWPMADRGGRPAARRIKTLTQAALNADATVEQVETLLIDLDRTVVKLNSSIGDLDVTLERFNSTITSIDELAPRLISMVERLENIVSRVEAMVDIGEAVASPLATAENAVRGVIEAVRRTTGL